MGHEEIIQVILDTPDLSQDLLEVSDMADYTVLGLAVLNGHTAVVKKLLKAAASVKT
jgi:ankyrin repeat protein